MPNRTATTHFVVVYGGCGSRGPEMSIAAYRGIAWLWDELSPLYLPGPVHPAPAWHWFLTMDPLNFTPHWKGKTLAQWVTAHPYHPESRLIEGERHERWVRYFNDAKGVSWTKDDVIRKAQNLGKNGENNVVLVLVGHGDDKDGSVTLEKPKAIEPFKRDDVKAVASRCRNLLVLLASCHAAKMFESEVPPVNVAVLDTISAAEKEGHDGLMQFLFLISTLLGEEAMKFQSKTVRAFAADMTVRNREAPQHEETVELMRQHGFFSWEEFLRGGRGGNDDTVFSSMSLCKGSGAPIVQCHPSMIDQPITSFYF